MALQMHPSKSATGALPGFFLCLVDMVGMRKAGGLDLLLAKQPWSPKTQGEYHKEPF